MKVSYPTLGPKGVITDPNEILRTMLTDGFRADYSQSVLFRDTVFSFQKIASDYGNDQAEHADVLETKLTQYLGSVFKERVEVTVVSGLVDDDKAKYKLTISAKVKVEGVMYDLGFALFMDDTTIYNDLISELV